MGAGGDLAEQHRVPQGRELDRREPAGGLVSHSLHAGQEGHEAGVARGFAHVVVRAARCGLLVVFAFCTCVDSKRIFRFKRKRIAASGAIEGSRVATQGYELIHGIRGGGIWVTCLRLIHGRRAPRRAREKVRVEGIFSTTHVEGKA